jgi:hypothetical protein
MSNTEKTILLALLAVLSTAFLGALLFVARQVATSNVESVKLAPTYSPPINGINTNSEAYYASLPLEEKLANIMLHFELLKAARIELRHLSHGSIFEYDLEKEAATNERMMLNYIASLECWEIPIDVIQFYRATSGLYNLHQCDF